MTVIPGFGPLMPDIGRCCQADQRQCRNEGLGTVHFRLPKAHVLRMASAYVDVRSIANTCREPGPSSVPEYLDE